MKRCFKIITFLVSFLFVNLVIANDYSYYVYMIPDFHDFLASEKIENSWGAFVPVKPAPDSKDHLNIQFSYENGSIGLDWVLLSPVNIRDREKFELFAKENGFNFELIEAENGTKYLRSEEEGIRDFCVKILTKLYDLSENEELEFYSGGLGR